MYPEKINERKKWIEELFSQTFPIIEKDDLPENCGFLLSLGANKQQEYYLMIDIELQSRERALLKRVSKEWKYQDDPRSPNTKESELARWILTSLDQPSPLPNHLQNEFNWSIERIPLLLSIKKEQSSIEWVDLTKEALSSYLPEESLYIRLNASLLLCLIPMSFLEHEEREEPTLKEWISGVFDVCQNELPITIFVLYHKPFTSNDVMIGRIRDLYHASKVIGWHVPIHGPVAPWNLIPDQIIQGMPDSEKERILSLFEALGALEILDQMESIQTLRAFFRSNLNISSTAKELYIHRNTLLYRLDRITDETGLDPRSFHDASLLQLAILLKRENKK